MSSKLAAVSRVRACCWDEDEAVDVGRPRRFFLKSASTVTRWAELGACLSRYGVCPWVRGLWRRWSTEATASAGEW